MESIRYDKIWIKSGRSNAVLPRDTINDISEILKLYEQMKAFKI